MYRERKKSKNLWSALCLLDWTIVGPWTHMRCLNSRVCDVRTISTTLVVFFFSFWLLDSMWSNSIGRRGLIDQFLISYLSRCMLSWLGFLARAQFHQQHIAPFASEKVALDLLRHSSRLHSCPAKFIRRAVQYGRAQTLWIQRKKRVRTYSRVKVAR